MKRLIMISAAIAALAFGSVAAYATTVTVSPWAYSCGHTDFGNPVTGGTSYSLCLYVDSGSAVVSAGIPGVANWKAISIGYVFHDPTAGGDGVFKTLLKGGAADKSKLLVKGRGANLDLSAMPLNPSTQVLVQLIRNDAPECWAATFPPASVSADDAALFKAKIP